MPRYNILDALDYEQTDLDYFSEYRELRESAPEGYEDWLPELEDDCYE